MRARARENQRMLIYLKVQSVPESETSQNKTGEETNKREKKKKHSAQRAKLSNNKILNAGKDEEESRNGREEKKTKSNRGEMAIKSSENDE